MRVEEEREKKVPRTTLCYGVCLCASQTTLTCVLVCYLCVHLSLQSDHFPRSQIYLSGCNVSDVTAKTDKKGKTFFAFRISHPHTTRDFRLSSKEQVMSYLKSS